MRSKASRLLVLLGLIGASAQLPGQSITLGWTASPDPTVTGYIIYWGPASENYTESEDVGTNTSTTISSLSAGLTYYFAATSYNSARIQSTDTAEITYTMPQATGTTFSFANLTQTYSGAPESVTVSTSPANLPLTVTYNGSANAPVNAGAYTVVATAQSPGSGSATNTLIINPAAATVTLSGLAAAYNGSAKTATVTTSPGGLTTMTTYNGSPTAPINVGSYAVLSTINNSNYTGGASGTLVISSTGASVVLSNLAQSYTGNACPVTAITTPSGLAVNVTYNGSSTAPTNCGNFTVVGLISSSGYNASVTNNLVISPAKATVALSALTPTYTGNAQTATVTTSPTNLATTTTYNGSTSVPTNAGSYAVLSTISSSNYSGSASGILVVNPAALTVTLSGLNQTYNGGALSVSNTTTPPGIALIISYNGSSGAPVNSGSYTVKAMSANANYTGGATNTLVIAKAAATVKLSGLNQTRTGSPIVVQSSTVPIGLSVSITYNGSTQPPTASGQYKVVGTIVNSNYVGSVTNTLTVKFRRAMKTEPSLKPIRVPAQLTLYGLSQIYDGTAKSVGTVTVPGGLAVTLAYSTNGLPVNTGSYTAVATISDPGYVGSATNTLTIYDPTNALILKWPATITNGQIFTSSNLTEWLPLGVNLGPTNQLVVPKQPGIQFFQGANLQIVPPPH